MPRTSDPSLRIIHAAMLGGTVMFFLVTLFMAAGRETNVASPVFQWGWLGPALIAVFLTGFVRGRLTRQATDTRVRASGIIIWALAEGTALFGMASTIVTGELAPAIGATLVGLFLMTHHRPSSLV